MTDLAMTAEPPLGAGAPTPPVPMAEAARIWAGRGWRVIPVDLATGRPLARAAGDPAGAAALWAEHPQAAIAVETGPRGGLFALAGDPADLDALMQGRDAPGPVWRHAETFRDVRPFLWSDACDGLVEGRALYRFPGVRVAAHGQLIQLPPAVAGQGDILTLTRAPLATPPAWLLEEIGTDGIALNMAASRAALRDRLAARPAAAAPATTEPEPSAEAAPKAAKRAPSRSRRAAYVKTALQRELRGLNAGDGAADALGRAAWSLGRFVAGGDLDQADASARLWRRARLLGLVGQLGEAVVRSRIETGLAKGVAKGPRVLPASIAADALAGRQGDPLPRAARKRASEG